MKTYTEYLNDTRANKKIIISELKSKLLFVGLAFLAYILIYVSSGCEEWWQNLFLGLGTGAATSALVSLVFYINDKQIKTRECIRQRAAFMHEFKFLYRNIIYLINFESSKDSIMDLESYVKKQHRWYHEYYKRMVAKNSTEEETKLRIEKLSEFISSNLTRFQQLFEYDSVWKNGKYTSWQKTELLNFYVDFKNIQIFIAQKDHESAIFSFAYFLERIKRMSTEFIELNNFGLLKFNYNEKGKLFIDATLFEEKESDFKFARQFQEIRINNYKELYAKSAKEDVK